MLPMMCIQPPCMNIEVSNVMQTMAVNNANGHDRPSPNEGVAVSQFLKENPHIENNDEGGDDGESAQRTRGIAERDQAAHYIPPLPRRIPMP